MRQKITASLIGLALGLGFAAPVAFADVWLCMQPNGTNLYSDRGGGPDCRLVKVQRGKAKDLATESITPVMRGIRQVPVASVVSVSSASVPIRHGVLAALPFAAVSPRPVV